jgi:isochorismate pyruvate lyase
MFTQAARIKQSPDDIVDTARIEFIVDRVRAQARAAGAPEPSWKRPTAP